MKEINEIIGDLLLQHNCVIVPSFGGFVAKRTSASIDFNSGTMLPPSKSLLFNKQLVNNDGLLVNEISRLRNLNFESASILVDKEIKNWNVKLSQGERIEIDRVGKIYLDAEKNLCFEQDRFYNLLLESYGLKKVHFLTEEDVNIVEQTMILMESHQSASVEPEVQTQEKVENTPIIEIKPETPSEKEPAPVVAITPEKDKRQAWKYIAAACLLPIAFYSFWIPIKTDVLESGVITLHDFNPFYQHEKGEYTPGKADNVKVPESKTSSINELSKDLPHGTDVYSLKYDEATYIEVKVDKSNSIKTEPTQVDINSSVNELNYIVGSFGSKKNANRLVKKLNKVGLDAKIANIENGMYRVSAGAAFSQEQIDSIAQKAKSLGHPGWVLR